MKYITLLTMSLIASSAMATSLFKLTNCSESEYTRANQVVTEARANFTEGFVTKTELAMTEVYAAEVALCAGKLNKSDACNMMIKNQQLVTGVDRSLPMIAGLGVAGKLDELRRLNEIKSFCAQ